MENETTSLSKIVKEDQVYGNVPREIELTLTSACLGGTIQVDTDKITGKHSLCMLVPTENGSMQPVVVTYGKEESVGSGAYQAIYHQLGTEELMEGKNNAEAISFLIGKFDKIFNLGSGNNYASTVLDSKFESILKYVKEVYPAYLSMLEGFKEDYMKQFASYYTNGKNNGEVEKKTDNIALSAMEAQTQTRVNV